MKNLKAITLFCLALLSQVVFAAEWTHMEMNNDGHFVKLSYTKTYLPATYGAQGGLVTARAFVDVYSVNPANAQSIEIFEVLKDGRLMKRQVLGLKEEHSKHAWVQLAEGPSYADHLYVGTTYLLKLTVNGRILEFNFKVI